MPRSPRSSRKIDVPGPFLPMVLLVLILVGRPVVGELATDEPDEAILEYEPFFFRASGDEPGVAPGTIDLRPRRGVIRAQFEPEAPPDPPRSSIVADPPVSYGGPDPRSVEDIVARDGPQIPEPMVFDLVRGLGARRGELEFNVLSLVPFRRGLPKYEWAPEVEYAIADGLAVEFELPIFDTEIVATKFAAQYTFGTALDDAFIHGTQGIMYYDVNNGDWIPTLLYLAGLRLDRTWSLFAMLGGSVGPQTFPFSDEASQDGTDLITNLSVFANVTDRLVLGVETNYSRQLRGPSEFLIMPQLHYEFAERLKAQFGIGMRDDVEGRHAELGFRIILER